MQGQRIEAVKSTLQFFLRALNEGSLFNIVSFGTGFERFSFFVLNNKQKIKTKIK